MSNIASCDSGSLSTQNYYNIKVDAVATENSHTSTTTNESNTNSQPSPPAPLKKKRSLPGNPDPSAEVISLSPNTLVATNRFICEICNKGFQRDQNLQLHRRGHNLPWKLKQRTTTEVRKRVYVCPESSCVHHNPARALGDLTGIKKHFSRKHCEKKWKCDKCLKKYAVQSDWKAHSKICGTKEYKCDCGTTFSRRDSYISHRAFCDALADENNKLNEGSQLVMEQSIPNPNLVPSSLVMPINTTTNVNNAVPSLQNGLFHLQPHTSATALLMGPPSFSEVQQQSYGMMNMYMHNHEKDIINSSTINAGMMDGRMMSGLDMFNAVLDQSKALSKIIEQNNRSSSVLDRSSSSNNIDLVIGGTKGNDVDVMTLDLLGIGGGRGGAGVCGNFYGQHESETAAARTRALSHFQRHAASDLDWETGLQGSWE